jgi:hypothetical protein
VNWFKITLARTKGSQSILSFPSNAISSELKCKAYAKFQPLPAEINYQMSVLFINLLYRTIPIYFIWLKYLSWFTYANEILVVNQWRHITKIGKIIDVVNRWIKCLKHAFIKFALPDPGEQPRSRYRSETLWKTWLACMLALCNSLFTRWHKLTMPRQSWIRRRWRIRSAAYFVPANFLRVLPTTASQTSSVSFWRNYNVAACSRFLTVIKIPLSVALYYGKQGWNSNLDINSTVSLELRNYEVATAQKIESAPYQSNNVGWHLRHTQLQQGNHKRYYRRTPRITIIDREFRSQPLHSFGWHAPKLRKFERTIGPLNQLILSRHCLFQRNVGLFICNVLAMGAWGHIWAFAYQVTYLLHMDLIYGNWFSQLKTGNTTFEQFWILLNLLRFRSADSVSF